MRLIWKALLALSGHAFVVVGGLVILIAFTKEFGANPQLAESAMWSSGLEVLFAVFGITLIIVGALTVAAANRLDTTRPQDNDPAELDKFYYLKPRVR